MPMWRCPHCGTPQAQAARCWVCKRSSTSCVTCRHFRRAVAGQLGYCGLDPRRQPLTGHELRGCWEETPTAVPTAEPARPAARPAVGAPRSLDFVPVETRSDRRPPAGSPAPGLWDGDRS